MRYLAIQHLRIPTTLTLGLAWLLLPAIGFAQLSLARYDVWTYTEDGSPRLGNSVAAGDFDGDGFDDMAIASPSADVAGAINSGRLHMRLTHADGTATWNTMSTCLDSTDRGDQYRLGDAIAFGDFDGDGDDDMAVGIPGATSGGVVESGAVCIVTAGEGHLGIAPRARFTQVDLGASPEEGDLFGLSLATGDLNADGYADLAIGSPGESVNLGDGDVIGAGAVHVLFGGPAGLTTTDAESIYRRSTGNGWFPAANEAFGSSLAIGHFAQAAGAEDLVIGAPGEHPNAIGGNFTLYHGQAGGTLAGLSVPMHVGNGFYELLGTPEVGDGFASALAPGDFDGDGDLDLAVGIPGDSDFGAAQQAGAVMIIYHDGTTLSDEGEQVFAETFFGGTINAFDRFGEALVAGDFDRDGRDDLAMGAPYDNSLGVINAGEVTVVYGTDSGLQVAGFQILDMIFFGTLDASDNFGAALATGKFFDSNGGDDLLVGVPGRVYDNGAVHWPNTGAIVVVQSAIFFADGFETGDLSQWSASSP